MLPFQSLPPWRVSWPQSFTPRNSLRGVLSRTTRQERRQQTGLCHRFPGRKPKEEVLPRAHLASKMIFSRDSSKGWRGSSACDTLTAGLSLLFCAWDKIAWQIQLKGERFYSGILMLGRMRQECVKSSLAWRRLISEPRCHRETFSQTKKQKRARSVDL